MSTLPNINEATIYELQEALDNGRFTSRDLVLRYMSRIGEIDKCENGLNSVLEINPDALFLADRLDDMRAKGKKLGALHGIPIMVKDNICTKDKMRTSAGSEALKDNFSPYDSHLITLLRDAGALIMGKTNMTEFANYLTLGMKNGYSSRGGQVLNPFDKALDVSGSSSGSGSAVSANLCAAAIGTETCGSIISPSIANGIAGLKPTQGRVSRYGIAPISSTLDTAGPMARSIADIAVLMNVICGYDEKDPATKNFENKEDFTKYLDKNAAKGARIGIWRNTSDKNDRFNEDVFNKAVEEIKNLGAECIEIDIKINADPVYPIMQHEFCVAMNSFLSTQKTSSIKTVLDIILYNQANPEKMLKYGQSLFLDAQNKAPFNFANPEYIEAVKSREKAINELDKILDGNKLDVVFSMTGIALSALTGFPSLTFPIGYNGTQPVGSFMLARRFDEKSLISIGYAIEQAIGKRRNPIE